MNEIKCPKCGSAAQIELVWEDHTNYNTKKIKEYVCRCGCLFEATFTLTETKILEENWH
jgi:hypothetical protein